MANEYLKRTPTSTGNRKVHTASFWAKINAIDSSYRTFFSCGGDAPAARTEYGLDNNDYFNMGINDDGSQWHSYISSAKGRDCGNWMHFCISVDSTRSDGKERIKYWINGKFIETIVANELNVNADTPVNDTVSQLIGRYVSAVQHSRTEFSDFFLVDGQALTPDVFGFYKEGKGYISAGSTQATDFRPGQWVPKTPRVIKAQIERNGGFGVNGFYLPMNDSSNFGADFHCEPNSIITLKGEDLPQPRNGAPETTDAYVSQLRTDPYAANLVLAVPGISGGTSSGYGDYSADIKGSGSNKTVTANGNYGVAVTDSYYGSALSFDGSGDYFSLVDSDDWYYTGDFTAECWVYPVASPNQPMIMGQWDGFGGGTGLSWTILLSNDSNRYLRAATSSNGSGVAFDLVSSASLPLNQWSHVCLEKTNSTVYTLYSNGVAVGIKTDGPSSLYNATNSFTVGATSSNSQPLQGYIQDVRIYKGVAKYKGGFDVPKPYTPVGIATWRAVPDTTANNFATWNALQNGTSLTDGNLTCTGTVNNQEVYSTIGITTGKWYVEARTNVGTYNHFGVRANSTAAYADSYRLIARDDGLVFGDTSGGLIASLSDDYNQAGDIVAMAIDGDNGQVTYYVNGVNVGGPYSIYQYSSSSLPTPYKIYNLVNFGNSLTVNFGQNPTFSGNTTAGTFTDSNGKGLFKYEPPSDFLALCEDNLPTPAIPNPGEYFKTVLWTGDGNSGRSITGIGFTPDLVWLKKRNGTTSHNLTDSVRGPGFTLFSDSTTNDNTNTDRVVSFNNDGFSLGNNTAVNGSSDTFVAWCWKAGAGTTSTNTNGSITSVVSVNQDAGFSIVSYTANQTSGATVGHGLGKTPKMIIVKERTPNTNNWPVYHAALGNTKAIYLDLTVDQGGNFTGAWNDTSPTSSVFSLGNSVETNRNSSPYIAYCWAEIEGFSKFGSYVGNGNADGPFVYTNGKPAFVMIKRTDSTGNWVMHDNARNSTNPAKGYLLANSSGVEETGNDILDFLSNGFKIRSTWTDINASGGSYVFASFAESPFQTANSK